MNKVSNRPKINAELQTLEQFQCIYCLARGPRQSSNIATVFVSGNDSVKVYSVINGSLTSLFLVLLECNVRSISLMGDYLLYGENPRDSKEIDTGAKGTVKMCQWSFEGNRRTSQIIQYIKLKYKVILGELDCHFINWNSLLCHKVNASSSWVISLNSKAKKCKGLIIRTVFEGVLTHEIEEPDLHKAKILCLAKKDPNWLFSSSQDGTLLISNLSMSESAFKLQKINYFDVNYPKATNIFCSKYEDFVYSGGIDNKVFITSHDGFQKSIKFEKRQTSVSSILFIGEVIEDNSLYLQVFRNARFETYFLTTLKQPKKHSTLELKSVNF